MSDQQTEPRPYRCRHLFTDGHQCGSPALRGELLCFYHHASRRPQKHQTIHGHTSVALREPEDLHAVQRGLAEVLRLAAANLIDDRHANVLLKILSTTSQNLARIDRQAARALKADPTRQVAVDYVQDPNLGTIAAAPKDQPTPEPRAEGSLAAPAIPFVLPPDIEDRPSKEALAQSETLYANALREMAEGMVTRAQRRAHDHAGLEAPFPDRPADQRILDTNPQLYPYLYVLEEKFFNALHQHESTPTPALVPALASAPDTAPCLQTPAQWNQDFETFSKKENPSSATPSPSASGFPEAGVKPSTEHPLPALSDALPNTALTPCPAEGPTARSIPAWGAAPGTLAPNDPRAENPDYRLPLPAESPQLAHC